ncbi:hypothetical protein HDV00_011444 [Rhizophlyctis rosea]|nr:hypothetical protein HDV00_011444 [Rhizophlyctis rosea]
MEIVCCSVATPEDWEHFDRVQITRIPTDESSLPKEPELQDNWGSSLFRFRNDAFLVFQRALAERNTEEKVKGTGCSWCLKYLALAKVANQPNAMTRFYFVIRKVVGG